MRPALIKPIVWWLIAVSGYVVFTSGFIYSKLNRMPMFRYDKDSFGKMYISEYFMKQDRSQYAGEGFIVSIIATFTSLTFLLFTRFDKQFPNM